MTEAMVRDALRTVVDPEIGLDLVTLGLIYGIEITDARVRVTYTLTTPGCPLAAFIDDAVRQALEQVAGGRAVETDVVFEPPWTPARMEENAWAG